MEKIANTLIGSSVARISQAGLLLIIGFATATTAHADSAATRIGHCRSQSSDGVFRRGTRSYTVRPNPQFAAKT